MVYEELNKFYNPTVETARKDNVEKQLTKLNGKSPVGEWVKGWYNGLPVNGFVLKIIGYGCVNVHWVKNKIAFEGKGTTIGFHGGGFEFYDRLETTKRDIKELIDLALDMKDFQWVKELNNQIK